MTAFTWNLLLAIAWMGLTGNFTGPSLVVGFLFGYLCLAVVENFVPSLQGYSRRVPGVILFAGFFVKEVIKANLTVAVDVATPNLSTKPGVIALPVALESSVGLTILANFITLTPGTLSLDISDDREVIYVHAMYLDDEEALLQELKEIERRIIALLR